MGRDVSYLFSTPLNKWLRDNGCKERVACWLTDDNTYHVTTGPEGICLNEIDINSIPFIIDAVHGDFVCLHSPSSTLVGCPRIVNGNFRFGSNELISLRGLPQVVRGGECDIRAVGPGVSYLDIHHYITVEGGASLPVREDTSGLLYWLLVPNITQFCFYTPRSHIILGDRLQESFEICLKLETIFNAHVKTKDILAAQDELIDAGLGVYATM